MIGATRASLGVKRPSNFWPNDACPTGILSYLPIHGAGYHDATSSSGITRVVSAYTTTVRTLKHSPEKASANFGDVYIAAMPSTSGDLPFARTEAWGVKSKIMRGGKRDGIHIDENPTVEKALEKVHNVSIAHFAGHAMWEPNDPSSSALGGTDGKI